MGWILKLSFIILFVHVNVAVYLIPKQILTQHGASYTIMLVDDDENIKPKQCYLTLKDNTSVSYEIDLITSGVLLKPINTVFSPVEETTNVMTSLGYGICGFKLDNVGENFVSRWNISFVDENETLYYKFIDVILRDIKYENKTQYVSIGAAFSVDCLNSLTPNDLLNCKLYDPQGKLIRHSRTCYHYAETSKMSDYGVWKCILQFKNDMSSKKLYHKIIKKENVHINVWQNETNMHVNIGCSISNLNYIRDYNFCEMIRPDDEILSLKEGLATYRYTALGTNISKAICSMEIKKPLKEFEKGLWRCEYKYVHTKDEKFSVGGFINVSSDSSSLPPPEIPTKILSLVNKSISMSCRVPYSSSYCYMRGPDMTIYSVENLEPTVGLCRYTREQVTMKDNGTWYCGFAKKSGELDELYSFQIVIIENYVVKAEKEQVETTIDSTVHLKCSTKDLGDYPVQYCRFKNPNGNIYNINPEENSNTRMSYYGRGFKYGDCGIEIKNVTFYDAGTWTCITRIGYNFDHPEVYSLINLDIK